MKKKKAIAEAPGKVIISGEHFVVHGSLALAAAIDKKVTVEATKGPRLSIRTALQHEKDALVPIERLVETMYGERKAPPDVALTIKSDLPDGAGLGSSAATMVATAAAVSRLEGWNHDFTSLTESAMVGEKMVHGTPSGIDAAISAMGGVILFRVGEPPTQLALSRKAKLLVVFSGKKRNTGALVTKVSSMKKKNAALFDGLCDSATLVSQLCSERLAQGDTEQLARLLTYNHAVLGWAGASTPALDSLVDLCLATGCLGAKLTGAGGGGSVVALAPPGEEARIAKALHSKGYIVWISEIPCEGVKTWITE